MNRREFLQRILAAPILAATVRGAVTLEAGAPAVSPLPAAPAAFKLARCTLILPPALEPIARKVLASADVPGMLHGVEYIVSPYVTAPIWLMKTRDLW